MATETIKVENGTLIVERSGLYTPTLEVSLSDIDSVSFERGGEGENQSDGTLTLFTKDGDYFPIRVADDEAGEALKLIYDSKDKPVTKSSKVTKTVDGEQVSKPSEQ